MSDRWIKFDVDGAAAVRHFGVLVDLHAEIDPPE